MPCTVRCKEIIVKVIIANLVSAYFMPGTVLYKLMNSLNPYNSLEM